MFVETRPLTEVPGNPGLLLTPRLTDVGEPRKHRRCAINPGGSGAGQFILR
jgi:hypothetical protein